MEKQETLRTGRSYPSSLSVKHLSAVNPDYEKLLRQTFDTKDVYIIVHPSYYVFFHKKPFPIAPEDTRDVVETFINSDDLSSSPTVYLLRDYERREKEFIASARSNNKIIILVLPGNYRTTKDYLYRDSAVDEYARYLNNVAHNAYSVFYIESKNSGTGRLDRDELDLLLYFIERMGAKNIYIGGGYIGRCQEQFYDAIVQYLSPDMIAITPELSSISPEDITDSTSKMLLTSDMHLNTWAFNYFIKNGGIKKLRAKVNIKNMGENPANAKGNVPAPPSSPSNILP